MRAGQHEKLWRARMNEKKMNAGGQVRIPTRRQVIAAMGMAIGGVATGIKGGAGPAAEEGDFALRRRRFHQEGRLFKAEPEACFMRR